MLRLAGAVGIPEHLGIEMGMMIDETGRHGQPAGVDGFRGAVFKLAHFDDFAVLDTDIGHVGRQAGTVDHPSTAYHEIISHEKTSC